ncbi:hypothetical protein C1645_829293 [Glomus cerebriforme]|uniref:Uncharacterized protein n=1 Tax=Glomus cerebriforme TaxID=658196 RepID=A0A397SK66_9GLOM|nr:hypothetical protein C1645_829293 [Glomus cerebriforme]
MSSRLFIKLLLNRSPKYISPYPTLLSFQFTRNNSFKPSFLSKNSYFSSTSLSSSNTSNKQSKLKKYYPYIYSYFIWVTFGSMLLHLTWSKMSYNEYKEKMQLKITKLEETIAKLENGENINNNLLPTKSRTDSDNGDFY